MNAATCYLLAIINLIFAVVSWPIAKLIDFVHWLITRDLEGERE